MLCVHCRKEISQPTKYCPYCGGSLILDDLSPEDDLHYHLPQSCNRLYEIKVYADKILFNGKYWYLKDKEFFSNRSRTETCSIHNFLGMGYLNKRSYRLCVLFVFGGVILEGFKFIADKLMELADKANSYLKWIGHEICLPDWINYTVNTFAVICIILAVMLFFSKKKVIEISFTDRRICVPQNSMSNKEYTELYQTIRSLNK